MSTFVKQVIVFGNKEYNPETDEVITDRAENISGEFDIDLISGILSFTLPYIDSNSEQYYKDSMEAEFKTLLKKRIPVRLYFEMFDTNQDSARDLYINGELKQIFEGVIDKIKTSRSKTDAPFIIECVGTLTYVSNEYKLPFFKNIQGFPGIEFFDFAIEQSGTSNLIRIPDVINNVSEEGQNVFVPWSSSNDLKEVFEQAKDTFGIRVHQRGDGNVNIYDPLYYFAQTQVPAYEYTLGYNMFNIDYGDLTNNVQVVEIFYSGGVGFAIDPTGMSLKASETGKNENDPVLYNRITLYRYDITSKDEAELAAKNYLLELIRNNVITFQCLVNPLLNCGDFVSVSDGEKYSGFPMWVKSYSFNISKSDCSMSITATRSVLQTQPEELIVNKLGITDLDILAIRKDNTYPSEWGSFVDV